MTLYNPKGDKTKRNSKLVIKRLMEMCQEQNVNPADTLTAEDVKKWMNITHAEKNMITLIATGYPVRNANAILRAIDMKLDRSAPKAVAQTNETQGVSVTVNTLDAKTTVTRDGAVTTVLPEQKEEPDPADLDDEEIN